MTNNPRDERVDAMAAIVRSKGFVVDGDALVILEAIEPHVTIREQPDPDPQPVPGGVAIATVRGVEGVVVWRVEDDTREKWRTAQPINRLRTHGDDQVTVTSRAVVITERYAEDLAERFERAASDASYKLPEEVTEAYLFAARQTRAWFAAELEGGAS
jgi:hypothetical protein